MCVDELKKSFNSFSPTTAFLVGFVGAVLVLCTIGFFVLLGVVFKGDETKVKGTEKTVINNTETTDTGSEAESLTEAAGTVVDLNSKDHVRGDKDAVITLIEYSDYECPYCKNFNNTLKELMDAYQGKIKWAYRHFPLSFHANAQKEAEAAECAAELGGNNVFWEFSDAIYDRTTSNGTGFALADLPKLAVELGLNKTEFNKCLDSGKYADYVKKAITEGTAAGIAGTPGVIIIDAKGNKQLIKGAYPIDMMKQIIDGIL